MGLNVMAALWPLRAGSLHVDFWVSERVLKKLARFFRAGDRV
ncbi:hypothetical protein LC2W_2267 [Lacticaseibacillus paracasei]|uniref:Uncharacterized protein n=1 Tax=Lacticaseibacillus paracasei subsp. paracasei TaxID=47714 RepID=A0AAP9KW75_LACPA|nr:hypothetical protein LCAZH_2081 [Lacticaseibacillus paracasei]AEA54598.1 hypothetical protein LC2W_2267 [Lacticaseibacillus paracasei]AEA57780.1 hypothetical protein LCBD_2285 [Lacticaseibacillus paracasei]EPC30230.1 hypothetical protein Lpp223_2731 [Lacticaseibacillus paracasei subsp. paracasei Lpp223]QGV18823.1 Hypothetical protein LCAKO_2316 [Lacticaseibacillus paracasei subsp. paracasei]